MIFQTGTATSYNALLNTLDVFLVANGWTQNQKTVQGAGQRAHYQKVGLHGTMYVNFRSFIKETAAAIWDVSTGILNVTQWNLIDGLAMNMSTGYSGASVWSQQPGRPSSGNLTTSPRYGTHIDGEGNIPTYYFFQRSSPELVVIVTEFQLGFFNTLIFGELDKTGAGVYTGGQFFSGTTVEYAPNSYYGGITPYYGWPDPDGVYRLVVHPFLSYTSRYNINNSSGLQHNVFVQLDSTLHGGINGWLGPYGNSTSITTYTGSGKLGAVVTSAGAINANQFQSCPTFDCANVGNLSRRSANASNLVSTFLPYYLYWQGEIGTSGQNAEYRFLGTIPDYYMINLRDVEPKQNIPLGADNYIVLPYNHKNEPFAYVPPTINNKIQNTFGMGSVIKTTP